MQPIKSCATELNVRFFKVMMAVGDRDRRMGAATHSRLRQRVKRAVLGARPMRQLHPKKRTQSLGRGSAAPGRFCCKSLFALLIKNSLGCRRDFRVKMWGTSSPDRKLTGRLRVQRSRVAGHVVLWRENYRPAIFDFCNNIGPQRPSVVQFFCVAKFLIRSSRPPRRAALAGSEA